MKWKSIFQNSNTDKILFNNNTEKWYHLFFVESYSSSSSLISSRIWWSESLTYHLRWFACCSELQYSLIYSWFYKLMKTIKKFWSIYNEAVEWECLYNNRLDTYWQWCSHNCSYCYARSLLDFRWLRHPENPKFIDLKEAYRIIAKEIPQWQITRLWWMTDCFQPVERIHKITYNVLKAFNKCRKWYLIITKSDLIATDEYLEVLDKELAHIQITITTTDDELASKYEKATRPSDRIKAIEKLQELWYDVSIRLSPYVPWLVKAEEINKIKCDKLLIEFLRVNWFIKRRFWEYINDKDFSLNYHWYNHLTFEKKKELVKEFTIKETTVCDFDPQHIEYRKKEFNPNKEDCCNLRK